MEKPFRRNWKGGQRLADGYVQIWSPTHPRARSHGYVARAVLVAEQKLGRPLKPGEVIHHINRQRHDDRPENIQVFASQAEHLAEHNRLRQSGSASKKAVSIVALCRESPIPNLNPETLARRLKHGMSIEEAVSKPLRRRFITHNGRTQSLSEWARELGIHPSSLCDRLKRSPVEVALTRTPPHGCA